MSTLTSSKGSVFIPWWTNLVQGIFSILIGFLLLTYPAATTLVIVQFVGIYWLVNGIFMLTGIFIDKSLWGLKLLGGILGILAGFSIFQHPLWSTLLLPTILVIFLGIDGLILGFVYLIAAFKGGGWVSGILGVISFLFGLLLLGSPLIAAFKLPLIYGILGIVGGASAVFGALQQKNKD
ncbi:MAG: DUF308 domain-containing protein [Anaerolineales bacterium]|jgi:uncharacterized membrane protein HdeD (DUF308 family)